LKFYDCIDWKNKSSSGMTTGLIFFDLRKSYQQKQSTKKQKAIELFSIEKTKHKQQAGLSDIERLEPRAGYVF
jgi:cellobiose-specific phosphotransferase system component IIB